MTKYSVTYQYLATIGANLITVAYGTLCGWPSSNFLILRSENTPLESGPMTVEEASWVTSILCLGGLVGNFFFGWLADKIGRKRTLILIGIPQLICWALIYFAKNAIQLCIARFLGGLAGGGSYVLIPLFVTEISEDRVRGSLGSFLALSCNTGILIAFIVGNFLSYYTIPCVLITFPILFIILVPMLRDTPYYLLKTDKEKKARLSLAYYRSLRRSLVLENPPEGFISELEKLKQSCSTDEKDALDEPLSWRDFTKPVARKGLFIGLVLMSLNQLCGCFAMLNYTASIFEESGSSLSPNESAIIVGVIQVLGAYISTLLVERAGRKILLCTSAFGAATGLITLGLYSYLKAEQLDLSNFQWVPIASFSLLILAASWGVLNLPFVVLAEILPAKIRSLGTTLCLGTVWFLAFVMIKQLPLLIEALRLHGCMFLFASFSIAGGIFVIVVVPETKGKSLDTILKMLE